MAASEETHRLAARFLQVFISVYQLTQQELPDSVLEQLNVNQLRALQLIQQSPGITQKEIAEHLDITAASVSVSISKMVRDTLVERVPDEVDGRVMRLHLGPRGQKLATAARQQQLELVADLLSGLPLEEQQTVVTLIERALAARQQDRSR